MTIVVAVLVVGFASARVARFLTVDDLLDVQRAWLVRRFPPTDDEHEKGWRRKVGDLATCPFCLGFWCSGGMLGVAHAVGLVGWPLCYDLVLWWAAAGVQALVNAIEGHL